MHLLIAWLCKKARVFFLLFFTFSAACRENCLFFTFFYFPGAAGLDQENFRVFKVLPMKNKFFCLCAQRKKKVFKGWDFPGVKNFSDTR